MTRSLLSLFARLFNIQPYSGVLSEVATISLYSGITALYGDGYSTKIEYSLSSSQLSQDSLTNTFIDGPAAIFYGFVKLLVLIDYSVDTNQLRNLYQSPIPREQQDKSQRRTRREVNGQFIKPMTLRRDEGNMRGKLYGGGTCELILTGDEIAQRPMLLTSTLPDTGVVKIAVLEPADTSWTPPTLPIVTISNHPLELLLSTKGLKRVKDYCRQPSDNIIVLSTAAPDVYIQTHHMQSLISHGQPINDEVVVLFLEIVCSWPVRAFYFYFQVVGFLGK
jgi:hypothetical protein